jgi:hypothetical protein
LGKKVSPFARQRFLPTVCGSIFPPAVNGVFPGSPLTYEERERMDLWIATMHVLGDLAKWRLEVGMMEWKNCSGIFGVWVVVNSKAPLNTMRAAQVLSDELIRILPRQPQPMFMPVSQEMGQIKDDPLNPSPMVAVAKNADLIAVIVGTQVGPLSKAEIRTLEPKHTK